MTETNRYLPTIILLILTLMWGSSFILVKRGLDAFGPMEVGALRIVAAGFTLLPFAIPRLSKLKRRHWKLLLIIGMNGTLIPAFLFAIAQMGIDSSLAGILNALTPFFVMVIGAMFFKQKFGWRTSIGLFIGFIGCTMLILGGGSGSISINWYSLLIILATVCYGLNLNLIKFYLADVGAVAITAVSVVLVLLPAIVILFFFTDFIPLLTSHPKGWTSAGYVVLLGIMSTAVALILFNKLVQMTTPIFTSSVTYFIPIVALLWGILDGERLTSLQYVAMAVIIGGVYITNYAKRRREKRSLTQ